MDGGRAKGGGVGGARTAISILYRPRGESLDETKVARHQTRTNRTYGSVDAGNDKMMRKYAQVASYATLYSTRVE